MRRESEAAATVLRENSGRVKRAPLALMIMTLYRQTEIYKRPSVGVDFTCHSNSLSWASSRGLGPCEYDMSQQLASYLLGYGWYYMT